MKGQRAHIFMSATCLGGSNQGNQGNQKNVIQGKDMENRHTQQRP